MSSDRFKKWATIELKLMLKELNDKKERTEEENDMIEEIIIELKNRGKYEQDSNNR